MPARPSLKQERAAWADERLLVIGYHTSFPSLGFVQRTRSAYRWLPLTYQLQV